MSKTLIPAAASAINPSLIAFKPRQVLLASYNSNMTAAKSTNLTEENKSLLLHSIAQYLHRNGFSKTLKKFRSEAELEEGGSEGLPLDLEEMCLRYLEKVNPLVMNSNGLDEDGSIRKKKKKSSESLDENENLKEKKKVKKDSDYLTKGSDVKLEEVKETSRNIELENVVDNNKQKKDKKKDSKPLTMDKENQPSEPLPQAETESKGTKKKKSNSSADASVNEDDTKADKENQPSEPLPQAETKSKDKKKKKSKSSADASVNEDDTKAIEPGKENGVPKKRKREESQENESHTEKKSLDESKRRKKDGSKEDKLTKVSESIESQADVCAGKQGQVDLGEAPKTPSKQLGREENGTLENSGEIFSEKKTMKKQNGSADPQSTTVKAFQRIKVDEVEFADDKLKDNSYWAKDGADIGYGAKAQEVLGQVRGRDFRHEKTKKKRGSYRGGQIDLQSHSVKFNYSDEE